MLDSEILVVALHLLCVDKSSKYVFFLNFKAH